MRTPKRMLAGVLVLLAVGLGVPPERALDAQPAGLILAVGAVGMTVENMERSTAFYSSVLGFERVSDVEVVGRTTSASMYRAARLSNLILRIDESRNCAEADLPPEALVVWFRRRVDAAAVLRMVETAHCLS